MTRKWEGTNVEQCYNEGGAICNLGGNFRSSCKKVIQIFSKCLLSFLADCLGEEEKRGISKEKGEKGDLGEEDNSLP